MDYLLRVGRDQEKGRFLLLINHILNYLYVLIFLLKSTLTTLKLASKMSRIH